MCLVEHIPPRGGGWTRQVPPKEIPPIMIHQAIKLPETHPDYPAVHQTDTHRVIVCPAAIQYILQRRKGSQWHCYSYHTEWRRIQKYNPYLGVPDASPCMLKHERTTPPSEAQGAVWESGVPQILLGETRRPSRRLITSQ